MNTRSKDVKDGRIRETKQELIGQIKKLEDDRRVVDEKNKKQFYDQAEILRGETEKREEAEYKLSLKNNHLVSAEKKASQNRELFIAAQAFHNGFKKAIYDNFKIKDQDLNFVEIKTSGDQVSFNNLNIGNLEPDRDGHIHQIKKYVGDTKGLRDE